ncbi:hypothetical protein H9Q69_004310 [Fusarium xylarioides]|uniref:Uncharacterized protein n=1 Tax=Fusarium xylarioides TaxID=221167 RepID=A0A9P7IWY1_9HYPO|nr:hypothetical protein H9Q72_000560 [Fusarium xylarioides]KAG5796666.1 hypothetical protein H9Q69_004310 [Fusarium xylarioides]KAG5820634.1 hypothetical protein H9Q71_000500 [Fusarium xylarioides]KAG5827352.1 hypothetical protein H9Q74_002583 [Fusarium xylarioides]
MSISGTVLPSIEDPNILTTFPSPGPSSSDREVIHSPEMQRVLDKFPSIDIEKVLDIRSKRIRESTQHISKRPTSRSGWFCRKRGLRNLLKDIPLSNTQETTDKDFRLCRNTSQHHGDQHTLEWFEKRGSNIMIVSRLSRNMGKHRGQNRLKLWTRFHKHIRDVINQRIQEIENSNGELARAFHIIQVINTPQELTWHLIRKHP